MSAQALSGLKIVEWGDAISGPYCAKLLGDLGAEVIKVETAGRGDRARSFGPFPGDIPHPEKSGAFLYLNTNKLGVTLNVECATGDHIFKQLVSEADVLIENHAPAEIEKLDLGFEALRRVNPQLVMTSISPFGQTGPYRDYKSCNLTSLHFSGLAYINPSDGVHDIEREPPLMGPANQGGLVAGLTAAVATMSAVFARRINGTAQHVDLSQYEALASVSRHQLGNYTVEQFPWIRAKEKRSRADSDIYPCQDGLVYLICGDDRIWERWVRAMDSPEWAMSEVFQDRLLRRENWDAAQALMREWTLERTVDEVVRRAEAARVPCKPVNTVKESVNSELLEARGYFVDIWHEKTGELKYPGAPYKLSRTPWRVERPAPLLGEHNEEVYCGRLGYARHDLAVLRATGVI